MKKDKSKESDKQQDTTYETCVVCRQETDVKKDTPIKDRYHYVEGSGQLCSDCYYEVYIKNKG